MFYLCVAEETDAFEMKRSYSMSLGQFLAPNPPLYIINISFLLKSPLFLPFLLVCVCVSVREFTCMCVACVTLQDYLLLVLTRPVKTFMFTSCFFGPLQLR